VIDPASYRLALDTLPHLVWIAAPGGSVEYMNRRASEFFGLPLDDLLGWDWSWVIHPLDLAATLEVWNEALRTGSLYEREYRLRRYDGEYRWFLGRAEPARSPDGKIVRWFGTCTDIDESKRMADQARAVRALFRPLVERSEDGLALVAADGTIRYANATAAGLLGLPAAELAGMHLWGAVHRDDRELANAWWESVLTSPGERLAFSARFLQRKGQPRRVSVLGTNLLPDPDVRAVSLQLRPLRQSPHDR
jgi:PAS domain S-box-containing protein